MTTTESPARYRKKPIEPGSPVVTTEVPEPRREIVARLAEIAPYPKPDGPGHARAVAKYLAVSAQRRWKYNLDIISMDTRFGDSLQAMMAEFAALHLLMRLMETDPVLAGELSQQIQAAWDDGGGIGEWLWVHGTALGVDPDEVSRLEEAWWAAPEAPRRGHRDGSGPG